MKKAIIALGFMLLLIAYSNFSKAQTFEKGKVIIDPYFGYPNFGRGVIQTFAEHYTSIDLDIKTSSTGPAGLRIEYMVADNFGLGFDFIYNSASVTFDVDSLNINGTVHSTYEVNAHSKRFRLQIRANYHFVQDDNIDAYVGVGVGTNTRSFTTDRPDKIIKGLTGFLTPISARMALGSRYYFTDNIGLNLELGLGGPLISAGFSIKI